MLVRCTLIVLMASAVVARVPDVVQGTGNVITGDGGNVVIGDDNEVHAFDPNTDPNFREAMEELKGKFAHHISPTKPVDGNQRRPSSVSSEKKKIEEPIPPTTP